MNDWLNSKRIWLVLLLNKRVKDWGCSKQPIFIQLYKPCLALIKRIRKLPAEIPNISEPKLWSMSNISPRICAASSALATRTTERSATLLALNKLLPSKRISPLLLSFGQLKDSHVTKVCELFLKVFGLR